MTGDQTGKFQDPGCPLGALIKEIAVPAVKRVKTLVKYRTDRAPHAACRYPHAPLPAP